MGKENININILKGKRKYDTYYIKKDVPQGMSICINQEDEDFAKLNFDLIEKQRKKQVDKEAELCCSDNDDHHKGEEIREPEPNKSNYYCAICKVNYPAYIDHIESKEHRITANNQSGYFNHIDQVINQLHAEKRWEKWVTEEISENSEPPVKMISKEIYNKDVRVMEIESDSESDEKDLVEINNFVDQA